MESKLFTPVTFGPLTLRNRTIRSAAFESMCPGNADRYRTKRAETCGFAPQALLFLVIYSSFTPSFFIYFCLIHGNTGNFSSFQFLHEARSILFFHTVIST